MRQFGLRLALVILVGGAPASVGGCRRGPQPSKIEGHNVLFITLDTTRADRIGAYGYAKARTPTIDALAQRGTLFEQAVSQVPLTLPSHASMLTGRYPREHGIRDNGRNSLSDRDPTLATIFKERGYRTAAFVAAFVLDSQFGLDRGFDVYNDEVAPLKHARDPMHAQQPANVIADRTLAWLNEPSDKPFFCWVHFYDPHDPYMPPPEYRAPDRDPYDGELAFVDDQLKRIFDWLESNKLKERTLVVLAGDHGESFNEHGERGHTNFVYATNMHVPLIFAHPTAIPAGRRDASIVELTDLFPTVLDLFGLQPPDDLMGLSLTPAFNGGRLPERDAYSESLYVFNAYGWAEQRSLTNSRWKYISSVQPELYDRQADPGETKNLVLDEPRLASDLLERLKARWRAMPAGTAGETERDAESAHLLAQLGYISSHRSQSGEELFLSDDARDPKEMKRPLELFRMGKALVDQAKSKEEYELVLPLLRDLTTACPDALQFQYLYGYCLIKAERYEDAIGPLSEAIKIDNQHSYSMELIADAHTNLNQPDKARDHLKLAVTASPQNARLRVRYGASLEATGERQAAAAEYREAIRLSPAMGRPYGKLCALADNPAEIIALAQQYERLIASGVEPPIEAMQADVELGADRQARAKAEMVFDLGVCLTRVPDLDKALSSFRSAIAIDPTYAKAHLNLGIALLDKGAVEEARSTFVQAGQIEGFEAEGKYHLGVVFRRESKFDDMARLWEEAIALNPAHKGAVTDLALYYRSQRRFADMVRILRAGAEALPNDVWVLNALGQVLATVGDDSVRDGAQAIAPLEKAAQLTGRQNALVLANLCAAHADAGDFERASTTCAEALQVAQSASPPEQHLIERIQTQIRLSGERKSFRDARL